MEKLQISGMPIIDYSEIGWDEYKKWIDGTYASLTPAWTDEGPIYSIVIIDGSIARICSINKENASDFEENYKNNNPLSKVVNGVQIVSTSYGSFQEDAKFKGFLIAASGIDTDTIEDFRIDNQIYITGGQYWNSGGSFGDYAEASVVDKDDILGLFDDYGLVSGVDVLELFKFVETMYINPESTCCTLLETPDSALVYEGLYLRTKIHTVSDTPLYVGITYLWFEE